MVLLRTKTKLVALTGVIALALATFGNTAALAAPGDPTITVSAHTLAENGSVDWAVTGDLTNFGSCAFFNDALVDCPPETAASFASTWVDLYRQYGAGHFEVRLYSAATLSNPSNVTVNTAYVSSDYLTIAASTTSTPDAVSDLAATAPTFSHVDLTWNLAGDGGTQVLAYKIYRDNVWTDTFDSTSRGWPKAGATSASFGIDGLSKVTTYAFKVIAVNANGDGAAASTSATTPDVALTVDAPSHATVNAAYSQGLTLHLSGFTGESVVDLAADTLPAGLTLAGSCTSVCSYAISGTATSVGSFATTLTLTLDDGSELTAGFDLVVDEAVVVPPPVVKLKNFSISFSAGSAALSRSAKATLKKVANLAKTNGVTKFQVVGYTFKAKDGKTSQRAKLALARAKAVAKALKALGSSFQVTATSGGLVNKGRLAIVKLVAP